MSSKTLLRIEKKVDVLLERVKRLEASKGEVFVYEAPLHQLEQLCPLCSAIIRWSKGQTGETVRDCECRPPI